jgi:hypothetical protein
VTIIFMCIESSGGAKMNDYRGRIVVIGLAAVASLFSFQAQAGCKDKLAEVDARMADSELADPTGAGAGAKMMRDNAATMCAQGNEAAAMQVLGMLDMMVPQTKTEAANQAAADEGSKAALTSEFLAGTWCAIVDQEHAQYVFSKDGTYRACIHDSVAGRYGYCMKAKSTAEWLGGFPRAQTVEQDTIVLGGRSGSNDYSTFKRGECSKYGR